MQSPTNKALGCVYVGVCVNNFSDRVGLVFALWLAPHMPTSLPKTQPPGHRDLVSYNHISFEVLLPLFCLFMLHVFKQSTKDLHSTIGQKIPKAMGSHSLLQVWGGVKPGSAVTNI